MNLNITKLAHRDNCVLVLIDIQEKLIPVISEAEKVIENTAKLINFSKIVDIPIVLTEQQKLGDTVSVIKNELTDIKPISKISFSCFGSDEFVETIQRLNKDVLLIAGIEAHICVAQTALQSIPAFKPHVVCDAISSRSINDCNAAIERMRFRNITITTTEMLIYELLEKAGTREFRETLPLVR